MLGRCFSIFLLLLVFASSSNAIKCWDSTGEDYDACSGYICKTSDGKKITGTASIDDVNDKCQLGWDKPTIKTIAKEKFKFEKDKFFVFSCQSGNMCNDILWQKNMKSQYQKEIKDAGLSDEPEKVECDPKKEVCVDIKINAPMPSLCVLPADIERLNKMSNGLACPGGDLLSAKQSIVCQSTGCTCWTAENTKAECDNNPKLLIYECDAQTDEAKGMIKGCSSSGNGNGNNGAEAIGYGFTILMAPLLASFFL